MFEFEKTPNNGLTKEFIFSKLSQEEIWYYYVPSFELNKQIKSPLRDDKNPSFSFKKYNTGEIIFTDWSLGLTGNIFTYLMVKYNVNYIEVLNIIYNDLIVNKPLIKKPIIYNNNEPELDKTKLIIPNFKPIGSELKFWSQYYIDISTLIKYRVKSCNYVTIWSKSKQKYFTIKSNYFFPIFCYEFIEENKKYYKVYRPYNKNYKWLFNGTVDCVEGFDQLKWTDELLIISKAMKDVMVLDTLGYNAISLQGETNPLKQELFNKLKKRFKYIILFYDNDVPGITAMEKISNQYNIPYIYIDNKYESKDISDFIKKFGIIKTKNFLNEKTGQWRRKQESKECKKSNL